MATSIKRVYWDSCSWIALIQDEKIEFESGIIEHRGALCRSVIDDARKGKLEIVSSSLVLIEVFKQPAGAPTGTDHIKDFFENEYVLVVGLDRRAGEFGRTLMQSGIARLKPPDASHLASAVLANVDELHTFDDDLLPLDMKITKKDGKKLKICKPAMGGPTLPLLAAAEREDEVDKTTAPAESSALIEGRSQPAGGTEGSVPSTVRGSDEGVGPAGGQDSVRPNSEADSGGESDTAVPTEETSQRTVRETVAAPSSGEGPEKLDAASEQV